MIFHHEDIFEMVFLMLGPILTVGDHSQPNGVFMIFTSLDNLVRNWGSLQIVERIKIGLICSVTRF